MMNMGYTRQRKAFAQPLIQQQPDSDFPTNLANQDPEDDQNVVDEGTDNPDDGLHDTVMGDESDAIDPSESTPLPVAPNKYAAAVNAEEGPASKRLSAAIAEPPPTDQTVRPGKLNRLAAILGGASAGYQGGAAKGFATGKGILDDNLNTAKADRLQRLKELEFGANLEDKRLGRYAQFTNAGNAAQRNSILAKNSDTAALRAKSDMIYKNAQIIKMQHPNMIFRTVNGRVTGIDPANPRRTIDVGDANMLSPVAQGQKDDYAKFVSKLTEGRERAIEGIRQGGENSRNAATIAGANTRNDNTIKAENERNSANLDSAESRGNNTYAVHQGRIKELSDRRVIKDDKGNDVDISGYFSKDAQGNVNIVMPRSGSEDIYSQLINYIYKPAKKRTK
jgi:hypothetical protein